MKRAIAVITVLAIGQAVLGAQGIDAGRVYQGKTIAQWIEQLQSEKVEDQRTAAEILGDIGRYAKNTKDIVQALTGVLQAKGDGLVRLQAVRSLGRIGPAAKEAVPTLKFAVKDPSVASACRLALWHISNDAGQIKELIDTLKVKDPLIRSSAIRALGEIGPKARAAMPLLIKGLEEQELFVTNATIEALGQMGTAAKAAVPHLAKIVNGEEPINAGNALMTLGALGRDAKDDVPAIARALRHPNKNVRANAISALGQIGPLAKPAVPELVKTLAKALTDNDREVRDHITRTLGTIGPEAKVAVPTLIKILEDPDEEARLDAAEALVEIGSGTKAAAKALKEIARQGNGFLTVHAGLCLWRIEKDGDLAKDFMRCLKNPHHFVREEAVRALRDLGPQAKSAVPALIEVLQHDPNADVRLTAGGTLGAIGPGAKAAIPSLTKALKDPDPHISRTAAWALGRIGAEAAVADLVKAMKSKDRNLRFAATSALANLGSSTEPVLKALQAATKDADGGVQIAAHLALWRLKNDTSQIPPLVEHLKKADQFFRGQAVNALGKIGPPAKSALPALREVAKGENISLRIASQLAIWKIARDPDCVPALAKIVQQQRGDSRWLKAMGQADHRANALSALGEIGPAAKSAVPVLIDALNDSIPRVRKQAAKALEKIDRQATSR